MLKYESVLVTLISSNGQKVTYLNTDIMLI